MGKYSKDHNNRTPPLTFRTYQILPHTKSSFAVFTAIQTFSSSSQGARGALPPWGTPGAPGGAGLDSCKDSESSCQYGVGSGRYGRLGGGSTIIMVLRVWKNIEKVRASMEKWGVPAELMVSTGGSQGRRTVRRSTSIPQELLGTPRSSQDYQEFPRILRNYQRFQGFTTKYQFSLAFLECSVALREKSQVQRYTTKKLPNSKKTLKFRENTEITMKKKQNKQWEQIRENTEKVPRRFQGGTRGGMEVGFPRNRYRADVADARRAPRRRGQDVCEPLSYSNSLTLSQQ